MKRTVGFLLIIAAALGLTLALLGLVSTWSYKSRSTLWIEEQVDLVISVLDTTSQGLDAAAATLQTTQATVQTLDSTIQTLAKSITDTLPLLDSIGQILGTDLPQTIEATQTSLQSAQASAKIMDDAMKVITAIPLLRTKLYNPEVPLHVALGEVSSSLDDMPLAFQTMEDNLHTTTSNLSKIQGNVAEVQGEVSQVATSLDQARQVLEQYQDSTVVLEGKLEKVKEQIGRLVNLVAILISMFFVWLAIAQLGLLTQGLDLTSNEKSSNDKDNNH